MERHLLEPGITLHFGKPVVGEYGRQAEQQDQDLFTDLPLHRFATAAAPLEGRRTTGYGLRITCHGQGPQIQPLTR